MKKTEIVGILNLDPQSFSGDGLSSATDIALNASEMLRDGASLLDVGAESTRPGAKPLNAAEEWRRLRRPLQHLLAHYPHQISLDTYKPDIVQRALRIGSIIVNDISGLQDPRMIELIAAKKLRCIVSHLPAIDAQSAHSLDNKIDSQQQVLDELLLKAQNLKDEGIHHGQIILDPGIGFGKTAGLNRQLISFAQTVATHDVMIGYSKKRFLGDSRMSVKANLEAGEIAISSGAKYLRLHSDLIAAHKRLI